MINYNASTLNRLVRCNGSFSMGNGFSLPIETDEPNDDAKEGTAAHWLLKECLHGRIADVRTMLNTVSPLGVFITSEVIDACLKFMQVIDQSCRINWIEHDCSFNLSDQMRISARLDYAEYNFEQEVLHIYEFKYGWRIVEPFEHYPMIAYALGLLKRCKYPVKEINLHVVQPRPYHMDGFHRVWTVTAEQFDTYANYLTRTLMNLQQTVVTGEHCANCELMSFCPAFAKATNAAIDCSTQSRGDNISNQALSTQLDILARAKNVIAQREKSLQELARFRLKQGQQIANYSLEMGVGNREWKEFMNVQMAVAFMGNSVIKQEIITPTQALKSGVDETIIEMFSARPNTGLKLVRQDISKKAERILKKGK